MAAALPRSPSLSSPSLTPTNMLSVRTAARSLASTSLRRWQHHAAAPVLNGPTAEDVVHFRTLLPESAVLSTLAPASASADDLEPFNVDWIGRYKGQARTVLRPQTTEQVSAVLKYCNERRIGVVPQGGNTGLVGGSVPLKDELVISLGSMNKVRSFDEISGALVADAGCVLEALSEHISSYGHIMPLDLGAKGRYDLHVIFLSKHLAKVRIIAV